MAIEAFFEIPADSIRHGRDDNREHERRFTIKTFHSLPPVQNNDLMLGLVYAMRRELRPFGAHPTRKNSYVTEPQLKRKSRWLWELIVPYSTEVDLTELELKERGFDENPLNKPADITMNTKLVKVIVTADYKGDICANTAGDPFPDIEDQETWLEFNIEKNIARAKKEWFTKYPNSVSQEEVKILGIPYPPKTLWAESMRLGKRAIGKDGTRYYPFHMKLVFREKGWKAYRLNTGTREKRGLRRPKSSAVDYELIPIRDAQGEAVDEPVFLDKHGRAYRIGTDPEKIIWEKSDYSQPLRTNLKKSEIITLGFEVKRPLPFKQLPLK